MNRQLFEDSETNVLLFFFMNNSDLIEKKRVKPSSYMKSIQ
jgi:hypothetical protein